MNNMINLETFADGALAGKGKYGIKRGVTKHY